MAAASICLIRSADRWYSAAYLSAPSSDPAELAEGADWEENSSSQLTEAVQSLDPRSRDILQRRWMTDDKATLHELADEYGISAERVRQVETNAIGKLKGLMGAAA